MLSYLHLCEIRFKNSYLYLEYDISKKFFFLKNKLVDVLLCNIHGEYFEQSTHSSV